MITNFNNIFNDKLIRILIVFLSFNNKKFILAYQMTLWIGVHMQIQCQIIQFTIFVLYLAQKITFALEMVLELEANGPTIQ